MKHTQKEQKILSAVWEKIRRQQANNAYAPRSPQRKLWRPIAAAAGVLAAAFLCFILLSSASQQTALAYYPAASLESMFASSDEAAAEDNLMDNGSYESTDAGAISDELSLSGAAFALQVLRASYKGENTLVSPLSLQLPLLLTYEGAKGETALQLRLALGLSEQENAGEWASYLLSSLFSSGATSYNSLWIQEGYTLQERFRQSAVQYYNTGIGVANFTDPGTIDVINRKISDQTDGAIPKLFDSLSPDTALLLANTLNFKANWQTEFDANITLKDQVFHAQTGDISVSMMQKSLSCYYYETDGYQLISLPYADSTVEMAILLPENGQSVSDVLNSLTAQSWQAALSSGESQTVDIKLPPFEMNASVDMLPVLKSMGVTNLFDPSIADLSGIAAQDGEALSFFVTGILQKSTLSVDESGTEAHSATGITMDATSAPVDGQAKTFTADRPFLFCLYNTADGSILFTGAVENPTTN